MGRRYGRIRVILRKGVSTVPGAPAPIQAERGVRRGRSCRSFGQITVQFSEAVRDAGPAGSHSMTNPVSYALFRLDVNNPHDDN